ncbi:hypothetical protein GGI05_005276, partial [Coemansia sp. RSA 2603]
MLTSGKKDSGKMPSGMNNSYANRLAMAAAVTRVRKKWAVAETSSAAKSGVKEVATTSDVDVPVTQHDIYDFWHR